MLKTSVVISTYNGERYLPELLDSIKNQSMKPDEVVYAMIVQKMGRLSISIVILPKMICIIGRFM